MRGSAAAPIVGDDPAALAAACDVLVDFSAPDALAAHLDAAVAAGTPIVIGTTGLGAEHHDAIDRAARKVAVLQSANMSLGVNLLAHLVRETAARLGDDWDVEIVEMHHRHKVDAPSGTALLLGAAAAEGRGVALDQASDRGRDGMTGAARARPYRLCLAARRIGGRRPSGRSSPPRASGSSSATAPKAARSSPAARSGRRSGWRTSRTAATTWPTCWD